MSEAPNLHGPRRAFIGVDPGTAGGIALFVPGDGLIAWDKMPVVHVSVDSKGLKRHKVSATGLRGLMGRWRAQHRLHAVDELVLVLERMQVFGGTMAGRDSASPTQIMSMGHSAGVVEGVMAAFCHRAVFPLPKQWRAALGLNPVKLKGATESASDRKRRLRDAALKRWPQLGRAQHDVCEAALMAYYGWVLTGDAPLPIEEPPLPVDADDPMAMPSTTAEQSA